MYDTSEIPVIESQLTSFVLRIDPTWDTYPEDNLKALIHHRHGLGPRTIICDGQTWIPMKEQKTGFLKNIENKKELFNFLSAEVVKHNLGGKLILTTINESLLSNRKHDMSPSLQPH